MYFSFKIFGIVILRLCIYTISEANPAMRVMVLYFEPQILYGIARPKIAAMSGLEYQWKTDTARQHLPTLLKRRVYKMASHGGAG